jgi:hypothetical protein
MAVRVLGSTVSPPPPSPKRARYTPAIWAALIVLYVALRSWHLTSYGLWDDEVFSASAAKLPWSHLFGSIAADAVHPPFFYVLLKLWIAGGGASLLWLKLLPLLLSVGALLPFWLLCRDLNLNAVETTLAFWLMTVNGYLIHYSQELRMYSLLLCISLWSLWLFLRLLNAQRTSFRVLAALFMVNVLLVYTHYFGWLFVGTEWICVLIWRRRRLVSFSLSLVALALFFAPWAYAVVAAYPPQGNVLPPSLHWISKPGWAELLWYLATLNGALPWRHTTPPGLVLFGVPIALAFYRSLRSQQSPRLQPVKILSVLPFPPIIVAFVASQLMTHSMWGERYLIIVAVPYLLLVAVSLSWVRRASFRIPLIVAILTWTGVASAVALSLDEGRLPWKSLAQHLIQQEGPALRNAMVYTFEIWAAGPLKFSLADLDNHQFDVVVTRPALMSGEHFWVAFRDTTLRPGDDPRAILEQRGCRLDAERSVHDAAQQVVLFRASC